MLAGAQPLARERASPPLEISGMIGAMICAR
jgi:hypothetical protein